MAETEEARYKRAKERVEALKGFYIHVIVYIVVNAGLFALNMLTSPGTLWFYWPLFGWGIGLVINGLVVFAGGILGPEWEERKVQEVLAEEQRRHTPRPT